METEELMLANKPLPGVLLVLAAALFILVATGISTGATEGRTDFLSQEEREWLRNHDGIIRVAPDPCYPPMGFFDEQGDYRGITANYLRLIEEKLNCRFVIVRLENFEEVLEKISAREVDLSPAVVKPPERTKYLLFTEPCISIPNVIVTRDDVKVRVAIDDLREIEYFAYQAGYAVGSILAERHDIIHGRPITNPADALRDLSKGRIDAMVGNLAIISFYVRRMNLSNVRVAGDCDFRDAMSFASRSDWPILNDILNKAILEITPEERELIDNRLIHLQATPFFHEMFDQHGAIMLLIDPEAGTIVDANKAAVVFYGYPREQLRSMHIGDINTMTPDEVEREFRAAAREERNYFIFPHRLANGEIRTVEVFSWPVTTDNRRLLFSIIHDITPRLSAEEALQKQASLFMRVLTTGIIILVAVVLVLTFLVRSQRRTFSEREKALQALHDSERTLFTLMSNLPGMAYRCKFDHYWTMFFVSGGCRDLTGYAPEDLVGNARLSYNDIIDPDDRDYVWKEVSEAIAENRPFTLEYRIHDAQGNEKWVWERGSAFRDREKEGRLLEGFITDISDRKNHEVELERFRDFFENIEDACFEMDLRGRMLFYNESLLKISGYTHEEYPALSPRDRHPPGEWDRIFQIYNGIYRTKIARQAVEYRILHKSGRVLTVEASVSLIYNMAGMPLGYRCIIRDITERKHLETQREVDLAEIKRLNAELEQRVARRTRELEESNRKLEAFAYSVSHDLRAPLRAIDGFSRALEEDCGDAVGEKGRGHINRIRHGVERMAILIEELLDLSRIARVAMRFEQVDLSGLAAVIADEMKQSQPERRIDVTISPGIIAWGDATLLRVTLTNLFQNAWKFTGKKEAASIEFSSLKGEKGEQVYCLRDDGVGFDMAYAGKIFDVFQRLHGANEFPGTGIGLAIVQRVIRRHGGRIWAESTPGQGAAFYFTLQDRSEG